MIPLSVLDLSPITLGSDAAHSFRNTLDLARHAERWGLPAFLARRAPRHARDRERGDGRTDRLCGRWHFHDSRGCRRHHAAEPFPAGDRRAIRHTRVALPGSYRFGPRPRTRLRLAHLRRRCDATSLRTQTSFRAMCWNSPTISPTRRASRCAPYPDWDSTCRSGSWVRVSLGLKLQRRLGLPYAFASHFAPAQMMAAIALYRAEFRPSRQLRQPYVMLGFNVFAADSLEKRISRNLDAAGIRESSQRPALAAAATSGGLHRAHRSAGAGDPRSGSVLCIVGTPEKVRSDLRNFIGADRRRRADDHLSDLRSWRAAALL